MQTQLSEAFCSMISLCVIYLSCLILFFFFSLFVLFVSLLDLVSKEKRRRRNMNSERWKVKEKMEKGITGNEWSWDFTEGMKADDFLLIHGIHSMTSRKCGL